MIQEIIGAFTFYNLTLTNTASGQRITLGSDITVTNNLVINGFSSTNRAFISSNTLGTARTITAANVSVTNTDFRDITGAGAGSWDLSAVSGGSGDAGGNSGITFTTSQTNYWVGNTGNWDDVSKWANSSGGTGGTGRVPLPQDDVRFDANSFSTTGQTVTANMPRLGKNIVWTGVTNTPAFRITAAGASIFGSLTLDVGMTLPATTASIIFEGRSSFNLDSAGLEFTSYQVALNAPGGTLTLQDDLTTGISKGLTINYGSFDANNFNYTAGFFSSSNSNVRSISLGSGTFTILSDSINNQWFISTITNLTFNAGASTIVMASTNPSSVKNFYGGGLTYNNLEITTSNVVIVGSNTFNKLSLNNAGQAIGTRFTNGTTQTVTSFETNGSAGNLVYASSTSASATATLTKAGGGTICEDYMHLTWMTGTPADTWYVGANSTNGGNNTGWIFTACPPTVTTQSATSITATGATLNGNITSTGGADVTVRGFAWGTNSGLSGGDTATTTENGTFGTGTFSKTDLTFVCNTIYYFRAYATNSTATSYGSILNFTTSACPPSGTDLSGTAYQSAGGSTLNSKTIVVYKNGATNLGSATTHASNGTFSMTTSEVLNSGDIVTLFVDGDSVKANTVFVSDGLDKTGLNIYGGALIVRHETGSNITNANLHTGAIYGESDMVYATSTSNAVTLNSNIDLYVWTGDTYAPGATLTTQGTGGVYIESGATLTASNSHNLTIAGNFANNGTFTHNNGEVILNTTKTSAITSISNMSFYDLTVTTAGKTIQFEVHSENVPTFSFDGQFTVTGQNGLPVYIQSTVPTAQWLVDFNVAQTGISNAYIRDSGCALGSLSVVFNVTNFGGGNNGNCWNLANRGADGNGVMTSTDMGRGFGVLRTGGAIFTSGGTDGGDGGGGEEQTGGGPGGGGGGTP